MNTPPMAGLSTLSGSSELIRVPDFFDAFVHVALSMNRCEPVRLFCSSLPFNYIMFMHDFAQPEAN